MSLSLTDLNVYLVVEIKSRKYYANTNNGRYDGNVMPADQAKNSFARDGLCVCNFIRKLETTQK